MSDQPTHASRQRLLADLTLLLVAVIWGSAFVAQRVAAQHLGTFLFNGLRFLLGGLILLPFARRARPLDRKSWQLIGLAGLLLFGASVLQQAGLAYTTAGNAGFITSLYVVLAPFILWIVWKQHIPWASWLAATLAVIGALLLSTGGVVLRLSTGDALELAGAALWALHVIIVGRAVQHMAVLPFAVGQYLVAGILNTALGLLLEGRTLPGLMTAWWTVAYIGVFSTALGYTLQAVGQRHAPPTDAAIILSLESVFAALAGYLLLSETLQPVQILGCAIILGAVLLAQKR